MGPSAPDIAAPAAPGPAADARPLLAVGRHPLTGRVQQRLAHRCAFAGGALVVGVSGGADSCALLLALRAIAARDGAFDAPLTLTACHVHHHLRSSADEDAAFVARLCRDLRVPLAVRDVRPASMRGNIAANARRMRYAALRDVAQQCGAPVVAVAHHAEDQFETMLMALCRGAGPAGLSAMAWRRDLPADAVAAGADVDTDTGGCAEPGGVALLRPLLDSRRAECEALCRAAGVVWRDDPTNHDERRVRGRLRRQVMPVLEAMWPDAPRRAAGAADAVRAAHAALRASLESSFDGSTDCWSRSELAACDVDALAAALRHAVEARAEPGAAVERRHLMPIVEAIRSRDRRPKVFDLSGIGRLHVTARSVRLEREEQRCAQEDHEDDRRDG